MGRPTKPKTLTVLEQRNGGGYNLKNLTEADWWKLGRYAFFRALREANEQANKRKGKVGR